MSALYLFNDRHQNHMSEHFPLNSRVRVTIRPRVRFHYTTWQMFIR